MSLELTGKVIQLGETQTVGAAGTFKKRLLVIETEEQYKQTIPIDFVQDKADLLNAFKVGDSLKVSINIRGNEYQGKYYCSLNGWRVEKLEGENTHTAKPYNETPKGNPADVFGEDPSDLPF